MRVCITGGAGFIGSHSAIELLCQGHDVTVVDNLSNSSARVLDQIHAIAGKSPVFVRGDVRDKRTMSRVLREGFDGVIHFAGSKSVAESVLSPLTYYDNNVYGLISLLEAVQESETPRVVFSSSATVYGEARRVPISEMDPVSPTTPYGSSKLMCEKVLADFVASNPITKAVVLRYFNPAGAHPTGLIGEDPLGEPSNLMPYLTQVAAGVRHVLQIYGSDYPTRDGTGVRDYVHVCDLANAHVKALEVAIAPGLEILNIGAGCGTSVLELVKAFERVNSVTLPVTFGSRRSGDVAESWADISLASRILGWAPVRGVDDICRDAWRWQRAFPGGLRG